MSEKLVEYFNRQPRLMTLSTADREGKVDCAVMNSPRMIDAKTVVMTLRNRRSYANLQENPYAVMAIMEPGKASQEWKGIRVYLRMIDCQTSGAKLEEMRAHMAERIGEASARSLYVMVTFAVYEVRPTVDNGQGWEASI